MQFARGYSTVGCVWCVMVLLTAPLVQASLYSDAVTAANPRGYWRLGEDAGPTAFDSATGDGAQDGIYNGAVFPGAPGGVAGDSDTSADFSGGNVSIADAVDPSAYTIEALVNMDTVQPQSIFLRTAGDPTSTWSHQIRIAPNGAFMAYTYDGAVKAVTGTTIAQPGQWYHVAATAVNNGQMQLFVNGAAEGAPVNIATLWQDGNTYLIGSNSGNGVGGDTTVYVPFDGRIDEAALYTYVLDAGTIAEHARLALVPEPASLGLLAFGALLLGRRNRR